MGSKPTEIENGFPVLNGLGDYELGTSTEEVRNAIKVVLKEKLYLINSISRYNIFSQKFVISCWKRAT